MHLSLMECWPWLSMMWLYATISKMLLQSFLNKTFTHFYFKIMWHSDSDKQYSNFHTQSFVQLDAGLQLHIVKLLYDIDESHIFWANKNDLTDFGMLPYIYITYKNKLNSHAILCQILFFWKFHSRLFYKKIVNLHSNLLYVQCSHT